MNVGLLVPDINRGHGWGAYTQGLIQPLHDCDVQTMIITATNCPEVPFPVQRLLPTVVPPARFTLPKMIAALPRVRSLLADCDVIHTTCEIYAPLAAWVAGERPCFITAHGSYVNLPRIRRAPVNWLYRWAFQQATLLCVSHYTQRIAREVVPQAQTCVIPNAIDPQRFVDLPLLDDPPTRPTVISVGGVKYRKGTLPLVRAMAQVREVVPDAQCMIIGTVTAEPDYVAQVRDEIRRLQLDNHVQLLGFVDEQTLLGWYRHAQVMALPSMNDDWKFEGFGLVHLAAGAAGLPVIGTTNCGAEDAIEHEVTGLLVRQDAVADELPQAIIQLLTNPDRAAEMGAAGRYHAQSYTWQDVARQVLDAYTGEC